MRFRVWQLAPLLASVASPACADILQFSCGAEAPNLCFFAYDNGLRVTNFTLAAGQTYTLGGARVGDPYTLFMGRTPPTEWPKCSQAAGCLPKWSKRGINM